MNGCCLHAERSAVPPTVPAPGDNGPAYLDWEGGAVPECLWAEVTSCTTAGSSQIPSWRMPEASQQTFPGWQWYPTPPLPPCPTWAPNLALGWHVSGPTQGCNACGKALKEGITLICQGPGLPLSTASRRPKLLPSPRPTPPSEAPAAH